MTVKLDLMVEMRDINVAKQIAQRAELGWFDTEFTMYGCAYMKDGGRFYRVSAFNEKIYEFIENGQKADILPSDILIQTTKLSVPVGLKEYFSLDFKRQLAQTLSNVFPIAFFHYLNAIGEKATEDSAYDTIGKLQKELIGCFEEKELSKFELLLNHVYLSKKITKVHYDMFMEWLKEERKYMEENIICKDVNKKTFYGFAYQDMIGEIKYVVNAGRGKIYQKKYALEQKNVFTTPVYSETYYTNYNVKTPQIQAEFVQVLRQYFDQQHLHLLAGLTMYNNHITAEEFHHYLEESTVLFGEKAKETLAHYGHRWGILR